MCQHYMELEQQLPSRITLLMFAFDWITTKERIMSQLFEDKNTSGLGWAASNNQRGVEPSRLPLEFSLARCLSHGLRPRDSPSTHFHKTAFTPPITFCFPLVIRPLLFLLLENVFYSSDELLVFLCLIRLVSQEHHRELTFRASSFYLRFSFIHSSFHELM